MPEENHVLGAIMSNFSVRTISVISCVIISLTRQEVTAANAAADSTPDNAQLFQMIKSLQAKVTVLEEQNARYRKQAEEARKEARPVRNSIAGTPSDRNDTTKQIAPATVAKRGQPDLYDASYLAGRWLVGNLFRCIIRSRGWAFKGDRPRKLFRVTSRRYPAQQRKRLLECHKCRAPFFNWSVWHFLYGDGLSCRRSICDWRAG